MAEIYKAGQGTLVRRCAFWGLVILIVWGGQSLYTFLVNMDWSAPKKVLIGDSASAPLPVLNQRLNVAFFMAWAVVGLGIWLTFRWLNGPRPAQFLVETDDELKKVTWPSWADAKNSSLIVILFVVVLALFLWLSDRGLYELFSMALGAKKP